MFHELGIMALTIIGMRILFWIGGGILYAVGERCQSRSRDRAILHDIRAGGSFVNIANRWAVEPGYVRDLAYKRIPAYSRGGVHLPSKPRAPVFQRRRWAHWSMLDDIRAGQGVADVARRWCVSPHYVRQLAKRS